MPVPSVGKGNREYANEGHCVTGEGPSIVRASAWCISGFVFSDSLSASFYQNLKILNLSHIYRRARGKLYRRSSLYSEATRQESSRRHNSLGAIDTGLYC